MKTSVIAFTSASFLVFTAHAGERTIQEVVRGVMSYSLMKEIVERHKKEIKADEAEARTHEQELKRFLALNIIYPRERFGMASERLDNLWHNFVLYTHDYIKFCNQHAGRYLHHEPTSADHDKEESRKTARKFAEEYAAVFRENPPAEFWPSSADDGCTMCTCSQCGSINGVEPIEFFAATAGRKITSLEESFIK